MVAVRIIKLCLLQNLGPLQFTALQQPAQNEAHERFYSLDVLGSADGVHCGSWPAGTRRPREKQSAADFLTLITYQSLFKYLRCSINRSKKFNSTSFHPSPIMNPMLIPSLSFIMKKNRQWACVCVVCLEL